MTDWEDMFLDHWQQVCLGDVCQPVETVDPAASPDAEFDYIDISAIDRSAKAVVAPKKLLGRDAPTRARQRVQAGDVLFSTVRPNLEAVAIVPPGLVNPVASTAFCVLRPRAELQARFLLYVLQSTDLHTRIVGKARGISYPAVRDRDVFEEPVPLPPPDEQRRIAERLDALLSQLQHGVECFRRALDALEAFRSACLAEAFVSAACRPLEELAVIQSGLTKGRPQGDNLVEVPYIRTANVQALRLDLTDVKTILSSAAQRAKHRLQANDVLVLEGGDADKVGRGWIWSGEVPDCLHQNHVFAVRTDPRVLEPRYLAYYVNAPQARRYFLSVARQSVNLASINKTNLRALPVPLCPIRAQRRAVERLDQELEATAVAEENLRARLHEALLLRRAVIDAAVRPTRPRGGAAPLAAKAGAGRDAATEGYRYTSLGQQLTMS